MRNGWTIPEYRYTRHVVTGICDESTPIWWYRPEVGVSERIICGGVTLITSSILGSRWARLGLHDGVNYLTQVMAPVVQSANQSIRYYWLDGMTGQEWVKGLEANFSWGYEIWIDHDIYIRGTVHIPQIDDLYSNPILLIERTIRD